MRLNIGQTYLVPIRLNKMGSEFFRMIESIAVLHGNGDGDLHLCKECVQKMKGRIPNWHRANPVVRYALVEIQNHELEIKPEDF